MIFVSLLQLEISSVTVTEYVPLFSARLLIPPQSIVYGPFPPPLGDKTIDPSLKVLQLISVIFGLNNISNGSVTVAESCTAHPFDGVIITVYVPGLNP